MAEKFSDPDPESEETVYWEDQLEKLKRAMTAHPRPLEERQKDSANFLYKKLHDLAALRKAEK